MTVSILTGDCRSVLATLLDESVHCCVTSPPYFGLRDYGVAGQIGLELTPDAYVAELVAVFREVRRVLRKDGTCWLNLGDSYGGPKGNTAMTGGKSDAARGAAMYGGVSVVYGKPKDLIGIPWRVAFALQADGWYLRQDIIWAKPNPMPESVRDRCTKAHEYLFLLSKSPRYYYDAEAIQEPLSDVSLSQIATYQRRGESGEPLNGLDKSRKDVGGRLDAKGRGARGAAMAGLSGRNRRSVWEVATQPYAEAHFATFPPALIEPCILAGCPERCCAQCGAPWVRETDGASYYNGDDGSRTRKTNKVGNGHGGSGRGPKNNLGQSIRQTLGFSPPCSCNADTVPGTILDPFGGAGTTGLVADRLKRNAVLIELNPAYADMARKRIEGDAPLFDPVASSPPKPAVQEVML